jgi:hypothetical protein
VAVVIVICIFVLIGAVVLVVGAPLRQARSRRLNGDGDPQQSGGTGEDRARRNELEAARESKYREIRDAELDFRTGKLSEDDYKAIDAELRAEALEILDGLEKLDVSEGPAPEG